MKELLGEEHVYQYVSFGLYQIKSAWKLYSRMENIPATVANHVSKCIEDYLLAVKYADEEDKKNVDPLAFIPAEYVDIFKKSSNIRKVIDSAKPHACGFICSPENVRETIGVITVGQEGKSRITVTAIEGDISAKLGYVKNDKIVPYYSNVVCVGVKLLETPKATVATV